MRRQPSAKGPNQSARGHLRTRRDHSAETAEDYAETIADLTARRGRARVVELAQALGVTHVTVVKTVGRLKRAGLVVSRPDRTLALTPQGDAVATRARARHELVVAFLRVIGVPAEIAEQDAEGIEHHASPETLDAMRRVVAPATPKRARRTRRDESP